MARVIFSNKGHAPLKQSSRKEEEEEETIIPSNGYIRLINQEDPMY